jgi:hypothetical protein
VYDRPSAPELLQAVRHHLEHALIPVARQTSFKLYFQTLVANNVLKIVEREIEMSDSHLRAEWSRMNMLTGSEPLPQTRDDARARLAERNQALCDEIRAGQWDEDAALFEHLKATACEQLEVANPRFLKMLRAEDAST